LEPEKLPRQNEIHDLTIAIVKNFVSEQPSAVIEKKGSTVPSRSHEVLVLVDLPEFALEALSQTKIPWRRSLTTR
jgi:hypothetical protein